MYPENHPGTIVYLDGNTGEITATCDIADVPEAMRFVQTETGWVPVVKVIAFVTDDRRVIREYGPGDVELRSTLQHRV